MLTDVAIVDKGQWHIVTLEWPFKGLIKQIILCFGD